MNNIIDLSNIKTIYKSNIITVKLKINHSIVASNEINLNTVNSPIDVYQILQSIYDSLDDDQEHVILLVFNIANELIGYKLISSGTIESSPIDCKILYRNALLLGASNIIIAHNHPAQDLKPSPYDLEITKKVVNAGSILDISVLDHIIYTAKGYTSIRNTHPELFDSF